MKDEEEKFKDILYLLAITNDMAEDCVKRGIELQKCKCGLSKDWKCDLTCARHDQSKCLPPI